MGARTGRPGCQTCSTLLMLLGLMMGSRQGASVSVHATVFGQFSFRIYFKEELPQVFRHSCRSYGLTTKPLRGHESDCVSSRVTSDRETEKKEAAERKHTRERDHSERRSRSIPEDGYEAKQREGNRRTENDHRKGDTERERRGSTRERDPKGTEWGAREIRVSCPRAERAAPPYTRRSAGGYTGAPHLIYVTKYICIYLYIRMHIYMYIYIAARDV